MGVAPIVAGTISLAVGAALTSSIRKEKRVTVSFFGDGAVGEGVLYECLNFAALKRLPIIFVCENNYYATHLPVGECRVDNAIYRIAEPFCIETLQADGNNVLQVYKTARDAVEKCRGNQGPIFLEFLTYRLRGHVGPDDNIQGTHTDIRPREEVEAWVKRDPIKNFEGYLIDNRVLDKSGLEKIREEVQKEVSEAHLFARKSPQPNKKELANHVFR
jgi:pyruvate dehydrogenase E1 component alpha subunit